MCKVLLLSDPGSRRWFVPFGKSFFVNSRESQVSANAELLVADREEGSRLCGEEKKNREEQILIGQLRRHHARPCIAHFLEAPLRISPGTFLDPGAGGHGEGQIPPGRKFCSLLAPAGMVGYNQVLVAGMGGYGPLFSTTSGVRLSWS